MEGSVKHTPLRILMTADTIGGVWSYAIELCQSLLPFSVQVYLVTTGAPLQPAQRYEVGELENVTVYETDYLLEWMDNPWQSIDGARVWLLQLEEELKPDLIHLNCYSYGALPWNAPVLMVAHSDVFSWWYAVHKAPPPAAWSEYYNRVSQGLNGSDFIIAPSVAMLSQLRHIYSPATHAHVVYNGRSSQTFYPAIKQPYILSMGRIWDEAKNIRLLTEAAEGIHYPIRIAGDSSFAGNTRSTIGANISYLGKLSKPEVAKQLSAASVYVLPAKYEPFGLSALEAGLSGCALVLGKIDSLREIWGESALYVDTDDVDSLAEMLNYVMKNEPVRLDFAHKGFEQAKKYNSELMADNYMRVYTQLLLSKKQKTVMSGIEAG